MRAAARADDRVNFVDDHRADMRQPLAALLRCQQEVERFRRRHENMRRSPDHRGPRGRGRVASSYRGSNHRGREAHGRRHVSNAGQRLREVFVNVAAERLERRNIQHTGLLG
jgi:hypothetical protein